MGGFQEKEASLANDTKIKKKYLKIFIFSKAKLTFFNPLRCQLLYLCQAQHLKLMLARH